MNEKESLTNDLSVTIDIEKDRIQKIKDDSDIPKSFYKWTWSDYKIDHESDKILLPEHIQESRKKAKLSCMMFAKNIRKSYLDSLGTSLIMMGRKGSGKSVLGTLILRKVIAELSISVKYVRFLDLITNLNTAYLEDSRAALTEEYTKPYYLMIDEMEVKDDFYKRGKDYLSHIITQRSIKRRPTIITTNIMSMKTIQDGFGESLYRIIDDKEVYMEPIKILTYGSSIEDEIYIPEGNYNSDSLSDYIKRCVESNANSKYNRNPKMITKNQLINIISKSKV